MVSPEGPVFIAAHPSESQAIEKYRESYRFTKNRPESLVPRGVIPMVFFVKKTM
jgi:hypothetical protein